ncbi:ABC transporter substrate-binding protein [Roseibium sp.]|uniref:ABC transporter substrate-binding protein n=1 Tax=Roseibium sp. TaxID=1936156 RepID=UPI003A97395F
MCLRSRVVFVWCLAFVLGAGYGLGPERAHAVEVKAGVLRVDYPTIAPVSRFDRMHDDLGFAGGALGNEDNQTTGSFMGHSYSMATRAVSSEAVAEATNAMIADGAQFIVVLGRSADILAASDAAEGRALVFNASASDVSLRDDQCRGNLLHIAPSRAMLADAVAQFLRWKKWDDWFLIEGSNPDDLLLGAAYRRAAMKFGARIVEERTFEDTGGSRRSDSGHVLVQRQIPVFTQEAEEHDVIVAADESDVFALYLPFHAWEPRPVAGSGGLRPVNFSASHEAWGATQFQRRFEKLSGRYMQAEDYNTWLALRVVGEAVTRTGSADPARTLEYILSDGFELAAFKGQKVTFRPWNGQLRQPIILTDSKITVSVSPQEGFLHQRSPLDTLGIDEPESSCKAFAG